VFALAIHILDTAQSLSLGLLIKTANMLAKQTLVLSSLLSAALAAPSQTNGTTNSTTTPHIKPKAILDNDWSPAGFLPFAQVLRAGWDVIGITSNTANTWARQTALHAVATLERGNLSCIPVYNGSDYPLLNTPKLFQAWEEVHGKLPWEGAFAPDEGNGENTDPTSGDPTRIVASAFSAGYPNMTANTEISAAEFMVQSVRKYPGEISIYAAGALTNLALAIRIDPSFAANARELVIMGGYLDVNLLQTTGSVMLADYQSDINLMIDPEGTKIALSAAWPNITIVGNSANQVLINASFFADLASQNFNAYTQILNDSYPTQFPLWDETAAAVMVEPRLATNVTEFYIDVDTSYASPSYGNIHAYQEALKPEAQDLRKVRFVLEVDGEGVKESVRRSVLEPVACGDV
jgi:inosine-uridine nucleoside N-ribohydrolase